MTTLEAENNNSNSSISGAMVLHDFKKTIKCIVCGKKSLADEELYICIFKNANNESCIHLGKDLCARCGKFIHDEDHSFDLAEEYILPVSKMFDLCSEPGKVTDGLKIASKLFADAKSYFVERGLMMYAVPLVASVLTEAAQITIDYGLNIAKEFVSDSGIGTVVFASLEIAYHTIRAIKGDILWKEWLRLSGRAIIEAAAFSAATAGGLALAAVLGGPITLGAVGGSIIGLLLKYGVRQIYDSLLPEVEKDIKAKFVHDALVRFGYSENDIKSIKIADVRRKFHKYALEVHPDRNDGDIEKWHQLSLYYGVLKGICERGNSNFLNRKIKARVQQAAISQKDNPNIYKAAQDI